MNSLPTWVRWSAWLPLLALFWTIANLSGYSHTHVDAAGNLIVHAHPHHDAPAREDGSTGHSHSRSELITLQSILDSAAALAMIAILLIVFLRAAPFLQPGISDADLPSDDSRSNVLGRAPPALPLPA
ncbi:MAG: hypothetical protein JXA28_01890 [Bacteroidetes bacterium]|nr:hypothetical protein [Bacteroidota bacterium]